jgi:hypothetical protein
MLPSSLLLFAGFAASGHPATAASRLPDLARHYELTYTSTPTAASRIPAWARKYNVNCSHCHYPAPPRLNATGLRFRWAGYRMPDEMGQQAEVNQVQNYLAAGLETTVDYEKTSGSDAAGGFSLPAGTVFYAGPFGSNYSGFVEFEFGPDNSTERIAQVFGSWGKEKAFGGFRVGQMHNLFEWGVAGFDRPVGIEAPTPLDGPLTSSVPFALGEHALGLEGFYVSGSNRLSAQVLNGITPSGEVGSVDSDINKDVLVTDQYLIDDAGSGVQAMGYYGSVVGLDPAFAGLASHFWRVGATANKIVNHFEVLGAVVFGKDSKLPAGAPDQKGVGYWASLQYTFPQKSNFTLYGRYEFVDPNTSTAADGNHRYLVGAVLPVTLPEYLRATVEYHLDQPQGGAPTTNAVAAQVLLFF